MRHESSVTSISWLPSEAVEGLPSLPFSLGFIHFDTPPRDSYESREELKRGFPFRFCNDLRAFVEVEYDRIIAYGHLGEGFMGVTTVAFGRRGIGFEAVGYPMLRPEPEVRDDSVVFRQTYGGRTAIPAPRIVKGRRFARFVSPVVWTSLQLTIYADGRSEHEVVGASPVPRHWIYDRGLVLVEKVGLIDFDAWYREVHGLYTPWGEHDSPALVTEVESALERQLSASLMHSGGPSRRYLEPGETLVVQGERGDELFLLLDGVLAVEVDDQTVAEIGPGAILGERAILEGGARTSTLRAVTKCRVAVASADQIDREALARIAETHRREEG